MEIPNNSKIIKPRIQIFKYRFFIWSLSSLLIILSIIGMISSTIDPKIGSPIRQGLDFTGGSQIIINRQCNQSCEGISTSLIEEQVRNIDFNGKDSSIPINLNSLRVQSLNEGKSILLRLPTLTSDQARLTISSLENKIGPFADGGYSVDTIGPSLGSKLLKSSLLSLSISFLAIAIFIAIRYSRRFASIAIIALLHDLIIVCGIFSWLGIFYNIEINSLFAVALLTICGYSVNDTVVVFDRIREFNTTDKSSNYYEKIEHAVNNTLTRTIYTSGTTLLPLIALILLGGITLYWFAIALSIGIVVGSWSSIALAPSLIILSRKKSIEKNRN